MRTLIRGVFWTLVLIWASVHAPSAWAEEVVVVVNDRAPVAALTGQEVREVFLGETAYWGDVGVFLVTYSDYAPIMRTFLSTVLNLSPNEYKSWWIRRIFRQGDVPPMRVLSAAEALRVVATTPGGIGFAYAADAEGVNGVREVFRFTAPEAATPAGL